MALTDTAHQLIGEHFADADLTNKVAVDATCGNGHDSVFLSQLGFVKIYAFDIQACALEATQSRLKNLKIENIELILDGHENLGIYLDTQVECVVFNLGYLPTGDKSIVSTESTSIPAIQSSMEMLSVNGLISILCYPGHSQGARETLAIRDWLKELNGDWQVKEILASHPGPKAPILYLLKRVNS